MSEALNNEISSALNDLRVALANLDQADEPADVRSRQLMALVAFGRRASAQPSLTILRQDAAAMILEVLSMDMDGIVEVTGEGRGILATVNLVDEQGQAIEPEVYEGPMDPATSAAAYALGTASFVATPDLTAETRYTDRFLRNLGIVSALTIPLHLGASPFGALGVYSRSPREFTPDDVRFAETIAHLLISAVARVKAEQEVAELRIFGDSLLEMLDLPVLKLDCDGYILDMNSACERTSEFRLEDVRGRPVGSVLLLPEEAEAMHRRLREQQGEDAVQFEGTMVTRRGPVKRVEWSLKAVIGTGGSPEMLLLASIRNEDQPDLKGARPERHAPAPPSVSPAGSTGRDRRHSPRRTYPYFQKIAPIFGGTIPPRRRFFEVQCRDLSAGGMAFYIDRPPDFDTLVIELGTPPEEKHVTARVMRVAKIEDEGRKRYLVGCRFTGRITL